MIGRKSVENRGTPEAYGMTPSTQTLLAAFQVVSSAFGLAFYEERWFW